MSYRTRAITCGLVVALGITSIGIPAYAVPQSELAEAKSRMESLGGELLAVQEELDDLTSQLEETDNQMERTQTAIDETTEQLTIKRDELSKHVRTGYKMGGFDGISFVLGSDSLDELLSRLYYMQKVNEHESQQIAEVNSLQDELETQLSDLEEQRSAQEERVNEAQTKVGEYESLVQEARDLYNQLDAQAQAELAAAAAAEAERKQQASAIAAAMEATTDQGASSGSNSEAQQQEQQPQHEEQQDTSNSTDDADDDSGYEDTPSYEPSAPSDGSCYPGGGVASAYSCIGWPYVWGGYSPSDGGFDCSGLVSYCYGDGTWRRGCDPLANAIIDAGLWKSDMSELNYGDLVFTDSEFNHVGIYIGNGQMIHSPTFGRTVCVQDVWYCYGGGPFVMPY